MQYIFDIDLAIKYGVNEAIMLQNIIFWLNKNKANEENYFDGHYWTFNSVTAWGKLYPFWTIRQIRTTLDSLIKQNVLMTGNYNINKYDRTLWYALIDESIYLKEVKDLSEKANQFVNSDRPIPDINTDVNKDININAQKPLSDTDNKPKKILDIVHISTSYPDHFEALWELYPRKVGKLQAYKNYATMLKKSKKMNLPMSFQDCVKEGIEIYRQKIDQDGTEEKFIKHFGTFINQNYWLELIEESNKKPQKSAEQLAEERRREEQKAKDLEEAQRMQRELDERYSKIYGVKIVNGVEVEE